MPPFHRYCTHHRQADTTMTDYNTLHSLKYSVQPLTFIQHNDILIQIILKLTDCRHIRQQLLFLLLKYSRSQVVVQSNMLNNDASPIKTSIKISNDKNNVQLQHKKKQISRHLAI